MGGTSRAAAPAVAGDCPSVPRWSFTQGVVVGQASFVILCVLFLKYVVFEDPREARQEGDKISHKKSRSKKKGSFPLAGLPATSPIPALLSSLSYDLPTHPPETLDWLNVLLAQTLSAYRTLISTSTAGDNGGAIGLMEEVLNRKGNGEGEESEMGLVGIDKVVVEDVALGEGYPVLSNARVRPSTGEGESGGIRVELDLDYTDHVSLSISTCLLVNFPRPRFAVLPISLGLTLERFSGTLTIELPSPLSSTPSSIGSTHPTLHFSLQPDFALELSTTSLLGSRAKLQDVPKVEQLILGRIRGYIMDRVVWPGRVTIGLPGVSSASTGGAGMDREKPKAGQVDGGWEWVEDDVPSDYHLPNADSDSEINDDDLRALRAPLLPGGSGAVTPTVEYDADGGPAVLLHPRIRPRPAPSSTFAPLSDELPRPPSPTESLPGHYRSTTTAVDETRKELSRANLSAVNTGIAGRRVVPQSSPAMARGNSQAMRYRGNGIGVGIGAIGGMLDFVFSANPLRFHVRTGEFIPPLPWSHQPDPAHTSG